MGLMSFIGEVTVAISTGVAANEIKDRLPGIARCLTRLAVRRLPEDQRERFAEEWAGHLDETTGDVNRAINAVGFLISACRTVPLYVPVPRPRLAFRSLEYERRVIQSLIQFSLYTPGHGAQLDGRVVEIISFHGCIARKGLLRMRLLTVFRPTRDWRVRYGQEMAQVARRSVIEARKRPDPILVLPRGLEDDERARYWFEEWSRSVELAQGQGQGSLRLG